MSPTDMNPWEAHLSNCPSCQMATRRLMLGHRSDGKPYKVSRQFCPEGEGLLIRGVFARREVYEELKEIITQIVGERVRGA